MSDSDDAAQVAAIATDYVEGWYTGDVARMDRALHPDLVKRTMDEEGRLRVVTKDRMIALTGQGGGEDPDAEFKVMVDHISDNIASIHVLSPEYLDYLHLQKTPDGWKIVNVLFRTHD
jgi:hypothetical protein